MLVDLSLGFLFWSIDLYICLCANIILSWWLCKPHHELLAPYWLAVFHSWFMPVSWFFPCDCHVFEVRSLPSASTPGSLIEWGRIWALNAASLEFKSRDLGASPASVTMCPHSVLLELLPWPLRRLRWLEQKLSKVLPRSYESTTGWVTPSLCCPKGRLPGDCSWSPERQKRRGEGEDSLSSFERSRPWERTLDHPVAERRRDVGILEERELSNLECWDPQSSEERQGL